MARVTTTNLKSKDTPKEIETKQQEPTQPQAQGSSNDLEILQEWFERSRELQMELQDFLCFCREIVDMADRHNF